MFARLQRISPQRFMARRPKPVRIMLIMIPVVIVGLVVLRFSLASSPSNTYEIESGTLKNVSVVNDSSASGGKYIVFTGPSSTPTPTATPTAAPITRFLGQTRPFADSSPWNTLTPTGTKWYDTSVLHTSSSQAVTGSNLRWYWVQRYVVVNYAKDTDPIWTITLPAKNGWSYCPQGRGPAAAKTVKVHAPANIALPSDTGGDDPMVFVDGTHYYELWETVINSSAKTITTSQSDPGSDAWAEGDIVSGQGFSSNGVRAGIRAADYSVAGGLITGHDIAQGKIDHALAMLIPNDMQIDGSVAPPLPFIYPATCLDTHNGVGPIKDGTKIGIPAGTAKPAGLSTMGSMIFDALQNYGAYVGDFVGGLWPSIAAEYTTTTKADFSPFDDPWDNNNVADYQKIVPLLRVANYQP